ncbi:MmcQ/YjbR family DNA-binding protein [Paenibacillus sp. GCM10027627]|uniref:MmcQ/YjbR family DNA-binding protein n=1 Tax=unclassified Paenibacillus TaxID=185978 RepID=UPI00363884FC
MRTKEQWVKYCLEHKGAKEEFPFGPEPIVMKVSGKMFALIGENDGVANLSLKCEPHMAELLRMEYAAVKGGYHLNKKHWNTVTIDGTVPDAEIESMIDHSYDLVAKSLTKAQKAALQQGDMW